MAAAAARGVDDASRAHVGLPLARVRGVAKGCVGAMRRRWRRTASAWTSLGSPSISADSMCSDTMPPRAFEICRWADAHGPQQHQDSSEDACVCSRFCGKFINSSLKNEIDTTKFRNTSARGDEAGSLEYQASNARTSRANAPLARTRLSRGSPRGGTPLLVIRGTMLNEARFLRRSVHSRRGRDAASGTVRAS